jgi:hypothetical protein
MTQQKPNQAQIQVGLKYQGSFLHQLYNLDITIERSHEELKRT